MKITETERKIINFGQTNGEYDGTCFVYWLDESFYNTVKIANCTDVLGLYVTQYSDGSDALSILISSPDDKSMLFVDLYELPKDVQERIINYLKLNES